MNLVITNLLKIFVGKVTPLFFIYIILLGLFNPAGRPSAAAPPAEVPDLFSPTNAQPGINPAEAEPTIIRSRLVEVNFNTLTGMDGVSGSQFPGSNTLRLNLFEDVALTAVLDRLESNPSGSQSWIGSVADDPHSEVTLVFHQGVLIGHIATRESVYEVGYVSGKVHTINQLDPAAFPPEANPIQVNTPTETPLENADLSAAGCNVDVLVAYTKKAREEVGGTTAMTNKIDTAIDLTNTGYTNSSIGQTMQLVHTVEVDYTEWAGGAEFYETTVARLRNTSDGYLDNLHTLRNLYGADLVVLLVDYWYYCGVGYQKASSTYAFSVVAHDCISNYSFAHETGHNMGSDHNRENACSYSDYQCGRYASYSYGYRYQSQDTNFRTIMAYPCTGSCPRKNYWSNPDILYKGVPMGIDASQSNSADNAQSINSVSCTISGFRTPPNLEPEAYLPLIIKQ